MEIANSAILDLLPQKSKEKYEYAYKRFMDYRQIKNIQSFSEHAIIAYFAGLSIKIKSSTLWSTYSMLRSTLAVKHNVNIAQFQKLRAFPKRKSVGYQPKKSKILMIEHVEQFILEAPHEMFLTTKCGPVDFRSTKANMVKITYNNYLTKTDPQETPVLIVGRLTNLLRLKFQDIKCKLEPRVTEEVFKTAIYSLHPSPTDTCSLYLNLATVAALPTKCSRHNTPSRSHAVTRLVQNCSVGVNESIVIVCERSDVFASGCAVARAFPQYSKKTPAVENENIIVSVEFIIVPSSNEAAEENKAEPLEMSEEELKVLEYAASGIRLTARIVDTPCNEMNVDYFLQEIQAIGTSLNITPTVIRGEQLAEKGFGGIYGVGKAAVVPPALAVLSYTPAGATTTVAWVGKGIVYDTGGLSIKGKTAMPGMKRDCGGAAAILGAFYAAVKSNFTQNLHAIFCLAENAVGPLATRPDDVHTLYSGRTVEINNTDAEGRLVLSDGVVYAHRDLKANIILDMATLTGAQGVATGKYHGAILTNNGDWEDYCMEAGQSSGDLLFPIPYCPELHFSEFASAIADMKNSVADRSNAQSSCAGLFIGAHLGFDFPGVWVHVDMASPVHNGERATGYGVALLCTLFGSYCKQPLLNAIAPDVESKDGAIAKKPRKN